MKIGDTVQFMNNGHRFRGTILKAILLDGTSTDKKDILCDTAGVLTVGVMPRQKEIPQRLFFVTPSKARVIKEF